MRVIGAGRSSYAYAGRSTSPHPVGSTISTRHPRPNHIESLVNFAKVRWLSAAGKDDNRNAGKDLP